MGLKNYFVLDGKSSADFNTYISKSNVFDGAEPDITTIVVPGRDGELTYSSGRHNAITTEIEAYIPRDMQDTIDGLRDWLSTKRSFARYEEALHPDEYRLARFSGAFTVSVSDRVGASLLLPFTFQPQRYLKSGEYPTTFTASGSMYNPTLHDAKPFIRAYGTGTLTIGDYSLTIDTADEYTDIDCELMDCYKDTTNCNDNVTLDDFPVLVSGSNTITIDGLTSVIITPRWYKL